MINHLKYIGRPENQHLLDDRNAMKENILSKANVILTTLNFIRDSHNVTMENLFSS